MLNELFEISTRRIASHRTLLTPVSECRLEERITPATRTTLAAITNASPLIFSGQSGVAVQWRLDTTTTYGTVVCFGFTNPGLVQNTQTAYLQHLRNGVWRTIETVAPEPTRIFLDRFGVIRTETPQDFRLVVRLKTTLTKPVVDVAVNRFGFTGTNGTVTWRGVSNIRLVQTGRTLSSTGLLYAPSPGNTQPLADINVGIGPTGVRAIVLHARAGTTFDAASNYRIYRLNESGSPIGNPLGTVVKKSSTTLIFYTFQRIDQLRMPFRVYADVTGPVQVGSFYATT